MKKFVLTRAILAGLAAVAMSCDDDDDFDDILVDAGREAGVRMDADTDAGADAAVVTTDAEIAAVLAAVNEGEIEQGQVAMKRAESTQVRDYAGRMVEEHSTLQTELSSLLTQLGITPQPNRVSEQLQTRNTEILTELEATSGATFDQAYLEAQVELHSTTLELLEEQLIPNVSNSDLRTQLISVRGPIQDHLEDAQALLLPLTDAGVADAGLDAGADAGGDGGLDAGADAGADAGDANVDSGA